MNEQGKIEKDIMRKAFDTPEDPYLPNHILYRQKEQFSDGVGYNWIDQLREKAEKEVTDEQFVHRANRFPRDPPATKEVSSISINMILVCNTPFLLIVAARTIFNTYKYYQ